MTQKKKRHSGVYKSDPSYVPPLKTDETIYNPFPYINTDELKKGVQRAYYIRTIRGMYKPPNVKSPDFASRRLHEIMHLLMSDGIATCEVQFLIYYFLGAMMDFLELGVHVLIPSFTLLFPDGRKSDILIDIAQQIEELNFTAGLIQELVAHAVQAEWEGLDRKEAKKKITKSINEVCINLEDTLFVKKFFTPEFLDDFLDVYNELGITGALLIAKYALNKYRESRETALERFQQALQGIE